MKAILEILLVKGRALILYKRLDDVHHSHWAEQLSCLAPVARKFVEQANSGRWVDLQVNNLIVDKDTAPQPLTATSGLPLSHNFILSPPSDQFPQLASLRCSNVRNLSAAQNNDFITLLNKCHPIRNRDDCISRELICHCRPHSHISVVV